MYSAVFCVRQKAYLYKKKERINQKIIKLITYKGWRERSGKYI